MTYFEFCGLLDKLSFELQEGNIKFIDSNIIKKCIELDNIDLARILFFRMQQCDEAYRFENILRLYDLCDLAISKKEAQEVKNIIEEVVKDIFDKNNVDLNYFEDKKTKILNCNKLEKKDKLFLNNSSLNLISKNELSVVKNNDISIIDNNKLSTSRVLDVDNSIEQINMFEEIYNNIKFSFYENGFYDVYKTIESKVGSAIFEEIRYDLNPLLVKYMLELYDALLNKSGNLINKKLFIEATKVEDKNILKLLLNIIFLSKFHEKEIIYDEYVEMVKNEDFENLLHKYYNLLFINNNFKDIDNRINYLTKSDIVFLDDCVMKSLNNKIKWGFGYMTYEESSNLYIILNPKNNKIVEFNNNYMNDKLLENNKTYKLSNKKGGLACI